MTRDLLEYHQIEILKNARVTEITSTGVRIAKDGIGFEELPADTVVLAIGLWANDALSKPFEEQFDCLYKIGDCRRPRNIMQAIWDAYEIARSI